MGFHWRIYGTAFQTHAAQAVAGHLPPPLLIGVELYFQLERDTRMCLEVAKEHVLLPASAVK